MADAKTNGYTKIDNDILINLSQIKLSPTQYRLILVIWRFTYGFQREQHQMSLTFLSNAINCDKRQVQRELKSLDERKIIVQEIKNGSYRLIGFNQKHNEWIGKANNGTVGETTIGEIDNGEVDNTAVGETDNGTIGETDNQERNSLNKSLKKDIIPFSEIINYLNEVCKTNYRSKTKKTRELIQARFNDDYNLENFKTVIDKKAREWMGTNMEMYLRPETLFGTKFEGYLNQKEPAASISKNDRQALREKIEREEAEREQAGSVRNA